MNLFGLKKFIIQLNQHIARMKKLILIGCVCICLLTSMVATKNVQSIKAYPLNAALLLSGAENIEIDYWIDSLYTDMYLSVAGLNREAFYNACKGYEYLLAQHNIQKSGIVTICDFSQPSNKKRLYVLDLNRQKILFNTYVAHGHNSGDEFATNFSNDNNSNESCLGFMVTAETYIGEHGYSMKLDGVENGFNDNVRSRSIVMHGSDYVCKQRVLNGVMMGRSFGCPALPSAEVGKVINIIKDGSCFYNYYPDETYNRNSKILNAVFVWPVIQSLQFASVKIPDSLRNLLPDQLN